jgi:hypothetical protein
MGYGWIYDVIGPHLDSPEYEIPDIEHRITGREYKHINPPTATMTGTNSARPRCAYVQTRFYLVYGRKWIVPLSHTSCHPHLGYDQCDQVPGGRGRKEGTTSRVNFEFCSGSA